MATIDSTINKLFQVIATQRTELEEDIKKTKAPWKTNCSLTIPSQSAPINIQTLSQPNIITIFAEMLTVDAYNNKAARILEVPFISTTNGFSQGDWTHDFKKRIAIISIKRKTAKLHELEDRLNAIVSPEQRRQMELDNIVSELE